MADIELVIKIPEDEYKKILLTGKASFRTVNAIEASTPLPKGHGRIGDLDKAIDLLNQKIDEHDKMMAKYEPYENTQIPNWMWESIVNQLVIIEADKVENEEVT